MSELKARLRSDLTAAMKARDPLTLGTLRMALAAIINEEVAGTAARELSDAEVTTVLAREVKKRKESAEAFDAAGRGELAEKERAESAVISGYLPAQLTDDEVDSLVGEVVAEVTESTGAAPPMKQMGLVIKAVQAKAAGRADGAKIAAAVKAALA
ncbi:MAG: GatB/YqeY domain-containing protein [Actinomycetota bacterium]|nr:GatB/YqeY domain-containing protein [Actinomycetota bacterium]